MKIKIYNYDASTFICHIKHVLNKSIPFNNKFKIIFTVEFTSIHWLEHYMAVLYLSFCCDDSICNNFLIVMNKTCSIGLLRGYRYSHLIKD
jgi:hypothetical protein